MTFKKITAPEFGSDLAGAHPSPETLELLATRRSTPADHFTGPGPDAQTLDALLEIAARVPDHRRLVPFRFIIIRDDGRERFGAFLADRFRAIESDAGVERVDAERRRFCRAPVTVAVVSRITAGHKTPEWEQALTCGAVCFNLLVAASAAGFAGQWVTEWIAFDEAAQRHLGLAANEKIAGFMHLGAAAGPVKERARPVLADIVSVY